MDMYQIEHMHRENKRFANRSKLDQEKDRDLKREMRNNLKDDASSEQSALILPIVQKATIEQSLARIGLRDKHTTNKKKPML